jgi:F0F1-type ATP synthase membrane subunit b/b'
VKIARQKIREEMANLAEATAQELVQSNLTAADQSRLVQEFIQHIG